jgi:exosortase/archaeosortase family protein
VSFWCLGFLIVALVPSVERVAIRGTLATLLPVLRAAFADVRQVVNQVSANGVTLEIVSDCTPLVGIVLLSGAILAYPSSAPLKLVGLAAGWAVLWIYDIARITALIVVLARWPGAFDLTHIYLWQTCTIAVVVGLFLLWTRLVSRGAPA